MEAEWNTLITSGAYIGEEMQAEFGRIPPAFLPIGAAFLVQHQLRETKDRKDVWVSLPNDYELTFSQEQLLDSNGVRVCRAEPRKSLGLSIFQAILEIGPDRPLEIMHGDTLIIDPPLPTGDAVSVSKVAEQYKWGLIEVDKGWVRGVRDADRSDTISPEALILSGYFAFREPWRLLKCLVARDFSFTGALDAYAAEMNVAIDEVLVTLDCGHLKTFYDSRRNLASARHFNSIAIESGVVRKRSRDRRKVDAEAHWLRTVPADLQPFTVRLIEDADLRASGEYRTLYSSYPTLAELYLARASKLVWRKVLDSCLEYLDRAAHHTLPDQEPALEWLVISKLRERMVEYPEFLPRTDVPMTINGHPVGTLDDIVEHLSRIIAAAPLRMPSVMHGDFCFSNILFDFRCDRILLIDPRGLVADKMTVYGDLRYDIAKLGHSVIGRYDQIIGGHLVAHQPGPADFQLDIPGDPLRDWLEDQFLEARAGDVAFDAPVVQASIVSLFLSMIPLHSDMPARQRAFLANALRLYRRFFEPVDFAV